MAVSSELCAVPVTLAKADFSVEVAVHTLGGKSLAVLPCSLDSTVLELKERLARVSGALVGQQQLVYGSKLRDGDSLRACGIRAPGATLQYVRSKPSGLAQILQERYASEDPSQAVEASLVDVVDSVMHTEHKLSEQWRVRRAEDVARAMPLERRAELVVWMVQAFDAFQLDSGILHGAVSMLDRYYAVQEAPLRNSVLQRTVLGAVCTELKLAEDRPGYWQRVVSHLCQERLSLPAVLETEIRILSKLKFVVGVPTPLTFLRGFSLRLGQSTALETETPTPSCAETQTAVQLALFLLELALFDPTLQYGQSHAILAGAALSAAFRATGAPRQRREELLEDMLTYDPSLVAAERYILECEGRLLRCWLDCSRGASEKLGMGYRYLSTKYCRELGTTSPARLLASWQNDSEPGCVTPAEPLMATCALATESFATWQNAPVVCA